MGSEIKLKEGHQINTVVKENDVILNVHPSQLGVAELRRDCAS